MRTIIILILIAGGLVALSGCGDSVDRRPDDGRVRVAASFYPLAFAAETIGGDSVEVDNLTPPGAEPHDIEVSVRDVEKIRSADLVLLLGQDFQPQLEQAAGSGDRVLKLLETPGLERFDNGDPHVWLDPLRYAVLAERIGVALQRERQADDFVDRLRELDRTFRRALSDCSRREVVTSHEAFAYLADRYELRQIAISGVNPEAEPTPRDLERVVSAVRDTGATTVFFETLVSPRLAQTVARETGAETDVLNPIEGLASTQQKQGEDYFSLMHQNLSKLQKALECRR